MQLPDLVREFFFWRASFNAPKELMRGDDWSGASDGDKSPARRDHVRPVTATAHRSPHLVRVAP